jgi:5-methylcytosine-specific restriction protein B
MPGPKPSLSEAVAAWDREAIKSKLATAETERLDVVARFPLEAWPTQSVDGYALGTDQSSQSFCYAMEFGTPDLCSIAGGSSRKLLIFKRRDTGEWWFDRRFSSLDEAWGAVRAGFIQVFDAVAAGDFEAVSDVTTLSWAPALTTKAAWVYFPDAIMPITSHVHIEHFWVLLGGEGPIEWSVVGARRLLDLARTHPDFEGWSPNEIMYFLYDWAHPNEAPRIVKIAPGHDAALWQDCLAHGYIRVGWDESGDLRDFATKEDFRASFTDAFGETYRGNQNKINEKANEVWTLLELEPGDLIVANRGTSHILGIGTVVEPGYSRRPELDSFRHTVAVNWDTTQARDIAPIRRWAFKTVAPISEADYARIMAGEPVTTTARKPLAAPPPDPILGEIDAALGRKGQVILYGPPGTGKTYAARRFAVWSLARQIGDPNPDELLVNRDRFLTVERSLSTGASERRVWWVVANRTQWSWDQLFTDGSVDYRYGRLARNFSLVQPGDLVVGYQSNPEKRIVALASVTTGLHTGADDEPTITLAPLAQVANGPTYDELTKAPQLSASEPLRFRNQGTLFRLTADEADFIIAWLAERDGSLPNLAPDVSDEVGQLTWVTFHPSYTYEDFVEGYKPVASGTGTLDLRLQDGIFKRVCLAARARPNQQFLLLIDEINRGNIPKIFGELITLLEIDKRNLTVTLPQSGDEFSVPPNVRLLGSMNTADRSIRLLDAALRRRFAFIELMPDPGLLEGGRVHGLDLAAFLAELNRRVVERTDREKQIGHSFLLDGDQAINDPALFAARFRYEILPLLQEYAFEDYRDLAHYLGDALIDENEQRLVSDKIEDPQALITALAAEFSPAESDAASDA